MNINQKSLATVLVIIAVVILFGVAGYFITQQQKTNPQATDFNMIFKYGVFSGNELNTFTQTYTKDMITGPKATIKLKLTDDELASIYQKLNDLDLLNESTEPIKGEGGVTPCWGGYLKAQVNSKLKELSWNNCEGGYSKKFDQFTDYVIQIIESKEEYKRLPIPRGGYM
jgi:hypothetical protein